MAITTKTINVSSTWTAVLATIGGVQFNDTMFMAVTDGTTPTEASGVKMVLGDTYTNPRPDWTIWAKSIPGGTNIESVKVIGEGI